jgi:hypothetical protein
VIPISFSRITKKILVVILNTGSGVCSLQLVANICIVGSWQFKNFR